VEYAYSGGGIRGGEDIDAFDGWNFVHPVGPTAVEGYLYLMSESGGKIEDETDALKARCHY
jgi:hypothetical protein